MLVGRIGKFRHDRIVFEEESLPGSGAVHQVELEGEFLNLEFATEREIADVFAGKVFDKVGRPERREDAVTSCPHQVVGIHVAVLLGEEGGLCGLDGKLVGTGDMVADRSPDVVAGDVVPEH